jgi:uncharacterized GH25 family protein
LLDPLQWDFLSGYAQTKLKAIERLRFQVTDSESNVPIPGAVVYLVYWKKNTTTQEKKEIEGKTDTNGLADFPRVQGRWDSCCEWQRVNAVSRNRRWESEKWKSRRTQELARSA